MIPIVFCASLAPWESEKSAELASWPTRKMRSTRPGDTRRKSQYTSTMSAHPSISPITGESTMNTSVFVQPATMIAPRPAFATAAPA